MVWILEIMSNLVILSNVLEKKLRCEREKNLPINVVTAIVMLESVGTFLNNSIKTSSYSCINIQ